MIQRGLELTIACLLVVGQIILHLMIRDQIGTCEDYLFWLIAVVLSLVSFLMMIVVIMQLMHKSGT